jgi:uncharacterized protein (DUF2336 family)
MRRTHVRCSVVLLKARTKLNFPNNYAERFINSPSLWFDSRCAVVRVADCCGVFMIVRHFLQWVRTAPAATRAEATDALARAYLHSNLTESDRFAAEGALTMLLDDPSPLVRRAMAEALAASDAAPPTVVYALANDQSDIAALVLQRSPLLLDADLVEAVASGDAQRQAAVAIRSYVPCPISAAIAEVGSAEACLLVLENPHAEIVPFSLDRIVERYGDLAAIRDVLLIRDDLSAASRQTLIVKLSETLADFVSARAWLSEDRARRIVREACEKATVVLAAGMPRGEVRPLIQHLQQSGQLNAGLILRTLLCGNAEFFVEALAELTQVPLARVSSIVHDRRGAGFHALYERSGLPASTFATFREVIEAMHEDGFIAEPGGAARLKRRIVERVLTRCEVNEPGEIAPLLMLLRRLAAECAREEARLFCEELAEPGLIGADLALQSAAA